MNIINRYIAKHIIQFILLVLLALLGVDIFFYLVNELRFVGKGDYHLSTALWFVALTIPRKIYILFPWSALLGTLLALGTLAKHSELVAMRTSAISLKQISKAVMLAAFVLTVCLFTFGEFISPKTEHLAQMTKTNAISQGNAVKTQYGIWVRNENEFIHVHEATSPTSLKGITIYRLAKNLALQQALFAQQANLNDAGTWDLQDIKRTQFLSNKTKVDTIDNIQVENLLDQEILQTAGVKHLERLALQTLWQSIKIRQDNELNATEYLLAFWSKIAQPFAVLVMVFLAIPFAFGPLRDSTMGLKVIVGLLIGFGFHILNQLFAPSTIVFNIPTIIAAFLPTVVFFVFGLLLLKRVR